MVFFLSSTIATCVFEGKYERVIDTFQQDSLMILLIISVEWPNKTETFRDTILSLQQNNVYLLA